MKTVVEEVLSIEFIYCVCNCGFTRPKYDNRGRPRKYIYEHNGRGIPKSEEHKRKLSEIKRQKNEGRKIHHKGYLYIYKPDHPFADIKGYVLEHRLVMEQYLGRYLTVDEVIHHKNIDNLSKWENKRDNRIENLELFSSHSKHVVSHKDDNRKTNILTRKCSSCGSSKTTMKNYKGNHRPCYHWHKNPFNILEWWCNRCYSRSNTRKWRAKRKS